MGIRVGKREWLTTVARGAVSLILPPVCALCRSGVPDGPVSICAGCLRRVTLFGPDQCRRCGRGLGEGVGVAERCTKCADRKIWPFAQVVAAGEYDGSLKGMVKRLKFNRQVALARPMAMLMADAIRRRGAEADVIVPVPLSWRRRWWRGFDQGRELAMWLGRLLDLPVATGAIRRRRHTAPQASLEPDKRRSNVARAFEPGRNRRQVSGQRVLLVDDVMTSGETAVQAARALRRVRVKEVIACVLARGGG